MFPLLAEVHVSQSLLSVSMYFLQDVIRIGIHKTVAGLHESTARIDANSVVSWQRQECSTAHARRSSLHLYEMQLSID